MRPVLVLGTLMCLHPFTPLADDISSNPAGGNGTSETVAGDCNNSKEQPFTALGAFALSGDLDKVQIEINSGKNIDAVSTRNKTPLMLALSPYIEVSLGQGNNENQLLQFKELQQSKIEIAHLLIEHGADVTVTDCDGMTALHYLMLFKAEDEELLPTSELLIRMGSRINTQDQAGYSPLILAAVSGRRKVIGLLLKNGADPSLETLEGLTALEAAKSNGHLDAATELEAFP